MQNIHMKNFFKRMQFIFHKNKKEGGKKEVLRGRERVQGRGWDGRTDIFFFLAKSSHFFQSLRNI